MKQQYRIEQVAAKIGVSSATIYSWYLWKKSNPDSELAELLPKYVQNGQKAIRYWNDDDIEKLKQFKNSIVHGRNGIMGDITQRYTKSRKDKTNGNN